MEGILRKTLQRVKLTSLKNPILSIDMISNSNIILYQNGSELWLGKNRRGPPGMSKLPEVIDFIIQEYFRSELTNELTRFAMFNTPIKEELELVINKVLKKYKLQKR